MVILAQKDVRNLYDLRMRYARDRVFIEIHLEIDGQISVERGHETAEEVEAAVWAAW